MHPQSVRLDGTRRAGIPIVVATLLVLGLAGCAGAPNDRPGNPEAESAPYVGVFTGEYVDGKPLYRFPPIHVVGSRSGVGDL